MKKQNQSIDPQIVEELIKGCKNQEDLFGKEGILRQLNKAILERMLEGELTTELGYSKHEVKGNNSGNSRNGYNEKTLEGYCKPICVNATNQAFKKPIIK